MSLLKRLRTDDRGFSLVELLMAMALGSIVLTATMMVFTNGLTGVNKASDRVEGTQRARAAVDRLTTLLSSMVCLQTTVAGQETFIEPVVAGSTPNAITFYGDLNGASLTPSKYTIAYDAANHQLVETRYAGIGTFPNVTFSGTGTQRITKYIYPAGSKPIFQYYGFSGSAIDSNPMAVSGSLTAAQAATVAKVTVQLSGAGDHNGNQPSARSINLSGEAIVPTSDPTVPTVCPN